AATTAGDGSGSGSGADGAPAGDPGGLLHIKRVGSGISLTVQPPATSLGGAAGAGNAGGGSGGASSTAPAAPGMCGGYPYLNRPFGGGPGMPGNGSGIPGSEGPGGIGLLSEQQGWKPPGIQVSIGLPPQNRPVVGTLPSNGRRPSISLSMVTSGPSPRSAGTAVQAGAWPMPPPLSSPRLPPPPPQQQQPSSSAATAAAAASARRPSFSRRPSGSAGTVTHLAKVVADSVLWSAICASQDGLVRAGYTSGDAAVVCGHTSLIFDVVGAASATAASAAAGAAAS
ncbi:unnamed protein product, partial [Phaeothamnion confervicola]